MKHVLRGPRLFFQHVPLTSGTEESSCHIVPKPFYPKSPGRDKACESCYTTPLGLWLLVSLALKQSQWGEMDCPGCENRQVSVVPSPFPKITLPRGKQHHGKVPPSQPAVWMHVLAGVCPWTRYSGPELPDGRAEPPYEGSHPSPSPWALVFDLLPLQEGLRLAFGAEGRSEQLCLAWQGLVVTDGDEMAGLLSSLL